MSGTGYNRPLLTYTPEADQPKSLITCYWQQKPRPGWLCFEAYAGESQQLDFDTSRFARPDMQQLFTTLKARYQNSQIEIYKNARE